MFCNQCEQTAAGQGCHQWGSCGKSPELAALQDLTIYCLRSGAIVVRQALAARLDTTEFDGLAIEALFATLTNVNFDPRRFLAYCQRIIALRDGLKDRLAAIAPVLLWPELANFPGPVGDDLDAAIDLGKTVELQFISQAGKNVDHFSLMLTVLYGLKGMAAYAYHARELGQSDLRVDQFIWEALAALNDRDRPLDGWVDLALRLGEANLVALELLDRGNTTAFGNPTPTPISLDPVPGKALLVSGHDLLQLRTILEQTVGTGINVYTHGELLPAHGYPLLKGTYPHLVGHYGTAWQHQTTEFAKFPGAIVMTTNCLMPPRDSYRDRVFSVGAVGWPEIVHLDGTDFSPAIALAQSLPGFTEPAPTETGMEPRTVLTGFGHHAVLSVADRVIDAVKGGRIRHFFLVGGCDGANTERSYYSDLVDQIPDDCIVLTLACGKFRFFDRKLGEIDGLPRLMDVGQCNDAYSAIQIAIALANAFGTDVNHIPLSMILSWYEQKAVAILLSLLHLGIQNIRLGPTLPAFLSPNVMGLLGDRYHLMPITTPEADLAACLG
ncbi:MAG: hydroxylamine reductase [Cyanobacteria bacterium]|nr:hydroxylamine reductase [Cyanobacteriota bacterium]